MSPREHQQQPAAPAGATSKGGASALWPFSATGTPDSLSSVGFRPHNEHVEPPPPKVPTMEENVYDHIWAAVERNGLTMRSVAAYLDRPVAWLILFFAGRRQPLYEDVRRLAYLLDLPLAQLKDMLLPLRYSLYLPFFQSLDPGDNAEYWHCQ